jgi:hypothetical protein
MQPRSILLGLLALALGCGPGVPEGQRETAPVEVTVTRKGQPVADAMVTFVSETEPMVPSNGKTNAEGKATMMTYSSGDGSVLGKHKVMIVKMDEVQTKEMPGPDDPAYDPNAPLAPAPKSLLPKKYANVMTSGLTADVQKGQPNAITFDLKD